MGYIADLTKAEIERLEQAKADIKAALIAKGASFSKAKNLSDYADIISGLPVGGMSCSLRFTNESYAHLGLPQLPIIVVYAEPNGGMKMAVVAVGETISLEVVANSPIVLIPNIDIAGIVDGYNNGRCLYYSLTGDIRLFIANEVSAVCYAENTADENSTFKAWWI